MRASHKSFLSPNSRVNSVSAVSSAPRRRQRRALSLGLLAVLLLALYGGWLLLAEPAQAEPSASAAPVGAPTCTPISLQGSKNTPTPGSTSTGGIQGPTSTSTNTPGRAIPCVTATATSTATVCPTGTPAGQPPTSTATNIPSPSPSPSARPKPTTIPIPSITPPRGFLSASSSARSAGAAQPGGSREVKPSNCPPAQTGQTGGSSLSALVIVTLMIITGVLLALAFVSFLVTLQRRPQPASRTR